MICPECGTTGCWELFGKVLAWEQDDAGLSREHFLTVACYNLQHSAQFTDDALANIRAGIVAYLDEGVGTADLRRRASQQFEGSRRVLKPESERRPVFRAWEMTIADVAADDEPAGAADRVRRWGAVVRRSI